MEKHSCFMHADVGVTDLRKKVSISPTNPSGDVKVKSSKQSLKQENGVTSYRKRLHGAC